jgi:hypothetical protein
MRFCQESRKLLGVEMGVSGEVRCAINHERCCTVVGTKEYEGKMMFSTSHLISTTTTRDNPIKFIGDEVEVIFLQSSKFRKDLLRKKKVIGLGKEGVWRCDVQQKGVLLLGRGGECGGDNMS